MLVSGRLKILLAALAVATCTALLFFAGRDEAAAMNRSSANVKHLTEGEFTNEVVRSTQPVVVDFYATWCEPCRVMSPQLDRLAGVYVGKIKFVKVNVDESPGLAEEYQAGALPMVLIFKDGKVVDRTFGLQEDIELKGKLDALALTAAK